MSALVFGVVVMLGGLFVLAISNPLAKLVTNWNLFIHQDPGVLEAYRSRKRRGIRLVAKVFLVWEAALLSGALLGGI
ncbi:hypothetical protein QFZ69_004619 [Arthrobacter sp. V1I7]|nr:hypothetical protein [Arthrobacter sp. V1I7]MDQ0823673.1 hypothetical protein [Arthrobacter sp. V1I7]